LFHRLAFIIWQFVLDFRRFLIDQSAWLIEICVIGVMLPPSGAITPSEID
jgi:hypothetical protein